MHVPQLIVDLAIMLSTAGIVTIVFRKLKLPVILGYILAGFMISPFFPLFLNVASEGSIEVLSEIGVIVILFHVGLEFDINKLATIGSTAIISAFVKMSLTMGAGYGLGLLLGLSVMDSVFLGAMLSISSTVVIQKCFEEQGLSGQRFTGLVMGSLVMEDIFGILIMVLLSTFSVSSVSGTEVAVKLMLMASYLVIWLMLGIYIIPTFLAKTMDHIDNEIITVASLGLCFLMALAASSLGFSMELGAFIAGSLIAGTRHAEKVEKATEGVKNLFGSIFFLSVGMMVEPAVISERWTSIVPIAIVAVCAKFVFAIIGVVLSGQDLNTAVKAGTSLAPIGEFSFIIASLGISLGVIDEYLYPVIVSASILTIVLTPVLIRKSGSIVRLINRILPNKLIEIINDYTSDDQDEEEKDQEWVLIIKSFASKSILYGGMMVAAAEFAIRIVYPALAGSFEDTAAKVFATSLAYIVIVVFAGPLMDFHSVNFTHLWLERMANRLPLMMLVVIKLGVLGLAAYLPLRAFWGVKVMIPLIIVVAVIILLGKSDIIQTYYLQLETRFLRNLNEKTIDEAEEEFGRQRWLDEDYSIFSFFVPEDAGYEGQTIEGLDWGRKLSVYVVKLRRGTRQIVLPEANTRIKAGDKLYVIGDESSLITFHKTLNLGELTNLRTLKQFMDTGYADTENALACIPIKVRGNEKFAGRPIKYSRIRSRHHCWILGIQRKGYAVTMPDANMLIEKGDILWVIGQNNNIGKLASKSLGKRGTHHD